MDVLALQVDPLSYKENLTMPKLVVDATGDEFFQVQDDGALSASCALEILPKSYLLSLSLSARFSQTFGGGSFPASPCV